VKRPGVQATAAEAWWARTGLDVRDGRLHVAGRDTVRLARDHGTPLYVYDLPRVHEQVRALQTAFEDAGLRHRVRLAMKAQREPEVLALMRSLGEAGDPESVGMDVCSPQEMLHALENGWRPQEISYTGTNVSERDLDVILAHPIHINADFVSQVERIGRRDPGRRIGLRINPRAGAGYGGGADTLYSRTDRPTKFGIFAEQLEGALEAGRRHDLTIDTVHFHVGDGFLTEELDRFEQAVERAAEMTRVLQRAGCPIEEVNTGGGLGLPLQPGDRPLDLDAYVQVLARHLAPLDVAVGAEPGDFLTKESAVLLAEVVTVEERSGTCFVGVDAGWNVMNDRFIYDGPQQVVVADRADATPTQRVTVAGHINEGDDLFAEDVEFPPVEEGNVLAILNCGSYAQSMRIEHCLRPPAPALFYRDRL
jgi:diaminopimelate decarboxylase